METPKLHTPRVIKSSDKAIGTDVSDSLVPLAKARRILGSLSKKMSDDQVREIIHTLHLIAKEQLCYSGSKIDGILNYEPTNSINN